MFILNYRVMPGMLMLVLFCLLSSSVVLADCGELEPVVLVPGDGACAGFTLDGPTGEAHNETELAEFVNGEAFVYVQYGFVAGAFQLYSALLDGTATYGDLKIFNQGSSENAVDLYFHYNDGVWDDIPDWLGTGEVRVRAAYGSTYLQFQEECFYVAITVGLDTDDAFVGARCLGENICAALQAVVPAQGGDWSRLKSIYR